MKQSRLMSFAESLINIAVGLGVAMLANAIILPALGFPISFAQNAMIAAFMTVVSIARSYALRRLFEAMRIRHPLSPGALAVIAERRRQIEEEGWTPEHDQKHAPGELARAGAAYAVHAWLRHGKQINIRLDAIAAHQLAEYAARRNCTKTAAAQAIVLSFLAAFSSRTAEASDTRDLFNKRNAAAEAAMLPGGGSA